MKSKTIEVGSCAAIISSISTMKDGGYKLTFEVNPDDQKVINKLMELYGQNEKLVQIGIVGVKG